MNETSKYNPCLPCFGIGRLRYALMICFNLCQSEYWLSKWSGFLALQCHWFWGPMVIALTLRPFMIAWSEERRRRKELGNSSIGHTGMKKCLQMWWESQMEEGGGGCQCFIDAWQKMRTSAESMTMTRKGETDPLCALLIEVLIEVVKLVWMTLAGMRVEWVGLIWCFAGIKSEWLEWSLDWLKWWGTETQ